MPALSDITPLVLTYNEAPNIERTLAGLGWARRVVVIDSGSTDGTVDLCRRVPGVEVIERPFDDHARQWNFGLDQVETEWVLSLDADYTIGEALVREMAEWPDAGPVNGYAAGFTYCVGGRALRAAVYPSRVVLFRRASARYAMDGHTQRLEIDGPTARLRSRILHDDRKPIDRWLADQIRYSRLEAEMLATVPPAELSALDRLRRSMPLTPVVMLGYVLIGRGGALDGWRGWYYALQRTFAELLLSLRLLERRWRS